MNWLISSAFMAISSVVLYLAARKSSLLKNPTEYTNLSMYLLPTLIFLFNANQQHISLVVTPVQLLILLIFAICFSWLGGIASLKSIEIAPNPGYSLVISKSYVIMTTIVAVLFFNAEISFKSIISILIIILGMSVLSIGESTNNKTDQKWLPLAMIAFVCWGMISLTSKYLFTIGLGIYPLLIYTNGIATLLIIAQIFIKKIFIMQSMTQYLLMLIMGISSSTFDYFMQTAIKLAPNVGYVNAINAGSIAIVTLGAALLFKDELTKKKLIGVLLAITGLVALVI